MSGPAVPVPELPPEDFESRPLDAEMPVVAPGLVWMAVHGYLSRALRHPGVQGAEHPSHALVTDFRDELGEYLVEIGILTPAELSQVEAVEAAAQPACEICRCTPAQACAGGCSWDPTFAKDGRAVCSRCVEKAAPLERRILTVADPEFHQPIVVP